MTLTSTGPTADALQRYVASASNAMNNLRALDLLPVSAIRGMDIPHATFLYDTFIVALWTYASFLQSFSPTTQEMLDAVDAGFISATILACRVSGKAKRLSTLPVLRALLRIPTPGLRRQILAHRYVARLIRITRDSATAANVRLRAQAAKDALSLTGPVAQVPGLRDLVPDFDHP